MYFFLELDTREWVNYYTMTQIISVPTSNKKAPLPILCTKINGRKNFKSMFFYGSLMIFDEFLGHGSYISVKQVLFVE